MQRGWCMKRDVHMSHSPPDRVLQCEGGDAGAGICDYETNHAMLGQRIAFAASREVVEGQGSSLQ